MIPSAPLRILIVAALCIAGLIFLVAREGMARDAGAEALLAMEAVDPRALLQGHYVIVDIRERLEPGERCPPGVAEPAGWIALRRDGEAYRVAAATTTRAFALQRGDLAVLGDYYCQEPIPEQPDLPAQPGWVSIDIGTDRYYASQQQALRIERVLREQNTGEPGRVFAIVSIGPDGRARLRGLMVDGERLELGWS